MKKLFKIIIIAIIRFEANLVLKRYDPKIVGVTGSVGKTGTKDAVAQVLSTRFKVRKSPKSFNHEFGVPLTILNCDNPWYSLAGWIRVILEGLSLIIFQTEYPEWLVLEVGVERPGDIKRLLQWVQFDIVIITRLPDVAVHVEFFQKPEDLIKEKLLLVRSLGSNGVAVLNADDPNIMAVRPELKAGQVLTYGWSEGTTVRVSNDHLMYHEDDEEKIPDGLSFRIDYAGNTVPFRIKGMLARHQLYGVLAAVTVGATLGINLIESAQALEQFETPPGRFKLLPGIKETLIIDDTYNSSPAALEAALAVLQQVETKGRKIAVLADMMELGPHTVEAHKAAGMQVAKVCDWLITMGIRAKFIREAAIEAGLAEEKTQHFDTVEEAAKAVQELLQAHDVVLVKGSQSMRLEKVVEEIMLHPEDKEKLLVRQDENWKKV